MWSSDTEGNEDDHSPILSLTLHGIAGILTTGAPLDVPLVHAEVVGDNVSGGDDEDRVDAIAARGVPPEGGIKLGYPCLDG